jgi:hypothetical protein
MTRSITLAIDEEPLPYAYYENPYPFHDQLRSEDPVHWSDSWNCWIVTRYDDAATVLKDWKRFSSVGRSSRFMGQFPESVRKELQPYEKNFTTGLIRSDPPQHQRLRRLVQKAFTPSLVAGMRPHIQSIVDDLLDPVREKGRMDVVNDYAYWLPSTVIAKMLGVPLEMRTQFNQWVDVINAFQGSSRPDPEAGREAQANLLELLDYFGRLLSDRRAHPRDDLVSRLAVAEEDGDRFNETEILATCQTLLTAGYETTMGLIGNGLLCLLRNPEQLEKLKTHPSLIKSAIEEFLRYESPIQRMLRVATEDIDFDGRQIRRGQLVAAMIGAANRDPAQFTAPDRLDITRRENNHIAFGNGIHLCLGAPLARLEGEIAIGAVVNRCPDLQCADTAPDWRENVMIRNLKSLPVEYQPASSV